MGKAGKGSEATAMTKEKMTFELTLQYKNPHKRTCVLGVQADVVLICPVFSEKLARKCF